MMSSSTDPFAADLDGEKSEFGASRWIVTVADLMMLLFCFFVLLTTISASPKNCRLLAAFFQTRIDTYRDFELRGSKQECVITLPSDYLFSSGRDRLKPEALQVLRSLFEAILSIEEHHSDLIVVEGHSDDVPIRSRRFPSNWELSAARATNVAQFMLSLGFPQQQMSVRAFAEQRPRVPYLDPQNRLLQGESLRDARRVNRRIEIILVDRPKTLEDYRLLFQATEGSAS